MWSVKCGVGTVECVKCRMWSASPREPAPALEIETQQALLLGICSHTEHFSETVYLNSLVHFSPATIPMHRRLWNMEERSLLSVECGV